MKDFNNWPSGEPVPNHPFGLSKPGPHTVHKHHHYAAHLSMRWLMEHAGIGHEEVSEELAAFKNGASHTEMQKHLDQIEAILFLHTHHIHPMEYAAIHTQLSQAKSGLAAELELSQTNKKIGG